MWRTCRRQELFGEDDDSILRQIPVGRGSAVREIGASTILHAGIETFTDSLTSSS